MEFTPVNAQNIHILADYYQKCSYLFSDYSAGIKLMWKNYHYEYAIDSGCLLVREKRRGQYRFDYPLPGSPDADLSAALAHCGDYCSEHFIPFILINVPSEFVPGILKKYLNIEVSAQRNEGDYLYLASDLRDFSGKKYAGQRNHVRKFHSLYPDAVFERFGRDDLPRIRRFWKKLTKSSAKGAAIEQKLANEMLSFVGSSLFVTGGYSINGEIISFCLSEVCGEVLVDHIEKALTDYEGLYPATVQAFAEAFAKPPIRFINREDDAGSRGLRISKLQYQPYEILRKHEVRVKTELNRLKRIPSVTGEDGLSLTPITLHDIPDYNRLCLDDERNRWWGYDYRTDCENPEYDYFYQDQKKDFANRIAMNLAIRLNGRFLGEVVFYHFDFCGGVEIGVRILPEADGQGLGRRALECAIRFAIYHLEIETINGRCMHGNIASEKMLSSVMHKVGEDETYLYFQRIV